MDRHPSAVQWEEGTSEPVTDLLDTGMKICLTPQVHGVGGMVSFAAKLTAGLTERGFEITHISQPTNCDAILVIGGTRDLVGLWRAKRRGIPIIQRLNGMNWLHRLRRTGWRHFLRAEYGNLLLATIRSRLATHIVYQSEFARGWWERVYGPTRVPNMVIHNGVDLQTYTPKGSHQRPTDCYRVLLVEGAIGGGYEMGLETAIGLVDRLNHTQAIDRSVELMVVGRLSNALQANWQAQTKFTLHFTGIVPGDHIPELDRSAHLLYSADLNAACPNAVIEALACGLPVVGFDTGALPELVTGEAGRVVPYGGNVWRLDPPDVPALAAAAAEILLDQPHFQHAARLRAEQVFGLGAMVDSYVAVFSGQ